jgi:hypothetical protein
MAGLWKQRETGCAKITYPAANTFKDQVPLHADNQRMSPVAQLLHQSVSILDFGHGRHRFRPSQRVFEARLGEPELLVENTPSSYAPS